MIDIGAKIETVISLYQNKLSQAQNENIILNAQILEAQEIIKNLEIENAKLKEENK